MGLKKGWRKAEKWASLWEPFCVIDEATGRGDKNWHIHLISLQTKAHEHPS